MLFWFLAFLWVASGEACLYFSTPKWMIKVDPIGYYLFGTICGAICGPFGVFWFVEKGYED